MNEVKALRIKNLAKKSTTTQLNTPSTLPCSCLSNNNSSKTWLSTSTQTSIDTSDLVPLVSSSSIASRSVQCLICEKNCITAEDLAKHAYAEHDVFMDVEKLADYNEEDDFLRFLKSMIIDQQYLEDRIKYYAKNSDHLYERIKIRIIAQIKFSSFSIAIERNMNKNDYKNSIYKGRNKEV